MRIMIGVISDVTRGIEGTDEEAMIAAIQLGRAVARRGGVLLTGAEPGLPYAATRGAQAAGGMVIGLSPAGSREEHERVFHWPVEGFDALIFTGVGHAGRLFEVIRSADSLVVMGPTSTLLMTTAQAHEMRKRVGVLSRTGVPSVIETTEGAEALEQDGQGISGAQARLLAEASAGAFFVENDPVRLIDHLVNEYLTGRFERPDVFLPQTFTPHRVK